MLPALVLDADGQVEDEKGRAGVVVQVDLEQDDLRRHDADEVRLLGARC